MHVTAATALAHGIKATGRWGGGNNSTPIGDDNQLESLLPQLSHHVLHGTKHAWLLPYQPAAPKMTCRQRCISQQNAA